MLASQQSKEASNLALERTAGSHALATAAQRCVRRHDLLPRTLERMGYPLSEAQWVEAGKIAMEPGGAAAVRAGLAAHGLAWS